MSDHADVDTNVPDGSDVSKAALRQILKDALGADGFMQLFHAAASEQIARDLLGVDIWCGTTGGTSTAYTCTTAGEPQVLSAGATIGFIAHTTNAGASTITIDSLSSVVLRHDDGTTAVEAGDIQSGRLIRAMYDGTVFRLLGAGNRLRAVAGGRMQSSFGAVGPSFVRAWCSFNGTTGSIASSYNVSAVVRNSTGNYTITWSEDFGTSIYLTFAMAANVGGTGNLVFGESTKNGTSVVILATSGASVLTDSGIVNVMAIVA